MEKSGKPYVLIQLLYWKQPQATPLEVVQKATDILEHQYCKDVDKQFCLVLDAYYGSAECHRYLNNLESFFYCCGLNASRHEPLVQILSHGMKWFHWKAVVDENTRIYSLKVVKDVNTAMKDFQLAVSNFHSSPTKVITESVNTDSKTPSSNNKIEDLKKLKENDLMELCKSKN